MSGWSIYEWKGFLIGSVELGFSPSLNKHTHTHTTHTLHTHTHTQASHIGSLRPSIATHPRLLLHWVQWPSCWMAHTEERGAVEERGSEEGLQGILVDGQASVAHILGLNIDGVLSTVEEAKVNARKKLDQPI